MSTELKEIKTTPSSAEGESFENQTLSLLTRLRATISDALAILPGGVRKSQDIQKYLGLSFNASWHIYRMMRAEHPLEITPHIPGPRPMKRLLSLLAKKGVASETIEAIREAYDAFENHVKKSSGGRTGFDAMTTHLGPGAMDTQVDYGYRRSLFEGHRYMLGIEQELFLHTFMIHPHADNPCVVDRTSFRLRRGFQRLRSDFELVIDQSWAPSPGTPPPRNPIDEEAFKKYGFYILPEFCSRLDLPLKQETSPDGLTKTTWLADGVGLSSAIDIAIGIEEHSKEVKPSDNAKWQLWTNIVTPTRKLITDIIVHRSAMGPVEFELSRKGYVADGPYNRVHPDLLGGQKMPWLDKMAFMGGIDGGTIAEVPKYLKMLKSYCEKRGWNPAEMHLYRLQIEYPVMHVLHLINTRFPKLMA